MKKPTVVFGYRFGVLGGVSNQLLNRLPAFREHFDVKVLFQEDHGMVDRFPDGIAVGLESAHDRSRWLEDIQPDAFVVIDSPALLDDWSTAGRPGVSLVEVHTTTTHLDYLQRLRPEVGIRGIITVSNYMVEIVKQTNIGAELPVAIVTNCLPDEYFDTEFDEAPDDAEGPIPIVWIGKLDGHKRVLTALELLDEIHERTKGELDVASILIGGYASGSERVRHLLRTVMNRPNLRGRLEWWPSVEATMMPGLLRRVASRGGIQLSTTTNESFGMAMVESLVAGTRVVAPSVGALRELIPHSMQYPEDDFDAAIQLSIDLLSNPDRALDDLRTARENFSQSLRPAAALNAFRAALERFSIEL